MQDDTSRQLERVLHLELDAIQAQGLHRVLRQINSPASAHIRCDNQKLINFSSNDYLGMACHPAVRDAAKQAIEEFGAGSGASRLICGSLEPHHRLEQALANFKGTEAALAFSSGYATALGTIPALVRKHDVVVLDKLVHACIVDAAQLSGATLRVCRHNDLNHLESILRWATQQSSPHRPSKRPHILIATESVFSMDGDIAPLREMVGLKNRYSAWLMVDEAHATGLYGEHRRGLVDEFGLSAEVEIQMGTLGKALGSSGGFICGSTALIDFLTNRARSFVFSTAPPPSAAASATAAIQLVQSAAGARLSDRLWKHVQDVRQGLKHRAPTGHSPILPLIVGDEHAALRAATALRDQGIYLPAIRYPSVPRNKARLRLTLSASHSRSDIRRLLNALTALHELDR